MKALLVSLRRLRDLAVVLLRHALAHALGPRLARWPALARRLPPGDLPEPQRLRMILEDLGGTFIKLGQMLALQPDVIPVRYCDALFDLLDRVAPFPYDDVERIFLAELGKTPAELFDRFDPAPFASASIGQVHRARLDGRELAVKVERPTVEVDFAGDVRLMRTAMTAIRRLRIRRLYWLLEPLSEFVAWTAEELDYRNEARYMNALRRCARDDPHQRVPEVYDALSTRRLLTVEYLDGVTLLDYLRGDDEVTLRRLERAGFDPRRFARRLIDNFLTQAFSYGIFHADLHPANLMILPGDAVGYVDFGITGTLSPFSRRHLMMLTIATARGDLEKMESAIFPVSVKEPGADARAYRAGLAELAEDWYERRADGLWLRTGFTRVMLDMLRLSRRTGIWPERDVIKYIRSSMAIDGLIRRAAPGLDLGRCLQEAYDRDFGWRRLRERVTARGLADWSATGARLLAESGLRTLDLLDRASAGALPLRAELRRPAAVPDAGSRPLALALLLLILAAIMTLTAGPIELGWNLFTAQALVAAAVFFRFVNALRAETS